MRTSGLRDAAALFSKSIGFYRPVVSLTFAADAALFGTQPLGYGLTNLALAALSAALLYLLLRALSLPTGAALFGSALWLFNPHGMNTAILWTSGRTALLLTAFALGAALAMVRGRPVWFLVCLAGALLSKEEAVTLPVILLVWRLALRGRRVAPVSSLFVWIGGSLAVIAAYAILRSLSGAMTPSTAPYYYAFTADPRLIARNVFEYLDRAATLPAGVTALALLLMSAGSRGSRAATPSPSSYRSGRACTHATRRLARASSPPTCARAAGRPPTIDPGRAPQPPASSLRSCSRRSSTSAAAISSPTLSSRRRRCGISLT
ncbi:MAG: hypothetical protein DMF85_17770 [Acidobacteria bacterium]|nr:MAG: hypothetical protein DMF85_17770 [Acidobacteriota bacterium]